MLFSSTVFLVFFLPLLLVCYFCVPRRWIDARNMVLLVFSIVFYAWGGVRYLLLLIASMAANYLAGRIMGWCRTPAGRKATLFFALAVNLGLLGYYKYTGFAVSCLQTLGLQIPSVQIVLPIGISFFTFQGLSYVIDVYRGDAQVQRDPLKIALYISLFPQLVAGPIVRYTTVEQELMSRNHSLECFSQGLVRFLFGLAKKMLLANPMGSMADQVFGLPAGQLGTLLAWTGAITYTLQIYFDFSAYSDMAIGLGKMFGFTFLENFNYPYISASVTEFWRRWHISLSTWFRDYVYIPLGGNRCSRARQILNLLITWSLTGMWHGADWTFLAWGLYFGVLLILEKYVIKDLLDKLPRLLRHGYTMILVICGWVLFRADSMAHAGSFLSVMFTRFTAEGADRVVYYLLQYRVEFFFALVAIFPVKGAAEKFLLKRQDRPVWGAVLDWGPKLLALGGFALSYMRLVSDSFNPFIYFQF